MKLQLAYGKAGLAVKLPDELDLTVVEPKFTPGLPDLVVALHEALRAPVGSPPLRDMINPGDRVGIVFCDPTRPASSHLMIPAVLAELSHVPPENITLFNALGTHRLNTETELWAMLGDTLVDNYRIVQEEVYLRFCVVNPFKIKFPGWGGQPGNHKKEERK